MPKAEGGDYTYKARVQSVDNDVHYEMASGAIEAGGFFKAMDGANVPDEIVDPLGGADVRRRALRAPSRRLLFRDRYGFRA